MMMALWLLSGARIAVAWHCGLWGACIAVAWHHTSKLLHALTCVVHVLCIAFCIPATDLCRALPMPVCIPASCTPACMQVVAWRLHDEPRCVCKACMACTVPAARVRAPTANACMFTAFRVVPRGTAHVHACVPLPRSTCMHVCRSHCPPARLHSRR
jgi:hypothetical protein